MSFPMWSAATGTPLQRALPVRVFDFVAVPPGSMRAAIHTASDIYRLAGVASEWLACAPSKQPPVPYHLPAGVMPVQVKILTPTMGADLASREAFGFAVQTEEGHPAFLAYVFYHRVEAAAHFHDIDPALLLGLVMAHEIGHLLGLGESGGVMRGAWTREDFRRAQVGLLRFSDPDGARLRAAAAARVGAGDAAPPH